jgi:acylphosphatase
MAASGDIRYEVVLFSGHVQGVGFRYTALRVAQGFEVAGFVQNLADGRVRVEVEGAPAEIDAFVAAVQEHMEGYVRKTERQAASRPPQFHGFTIR